MPTYAYRCRDCGHDLEVVQKFDDAALTECPACGGSLRKVFNPVGVVFKGSGFYRTDSRAKPGNGQTPKSDGAKESTSKSGSEGSTGDSSSSTKETSSTSSSNAKPAGTAVQSAAKS